MVDDGESRFHSEGWLTVRKVTPSERQPRRIDLWHLQPKPSNFGLVHGVT